MNRPTKYTFASYGLILWASLLSACANKVDTLQNESQPSQLGRHDTAPSNEDQESPFQPSFAGLMAELGQYMDDVYRFWDSQSMRDTSIERLEQMIEIHDQCLAIYNEYLATLGDDTLKAQSERFKRYLLKSKELTIRLKEAVQSGDGEAVKEALHHLDQNRRKAHSTFG